MGYTDLIDSFTKYTFPNNYQLQRLKCVFIQLNGRVNCKPAFFRLSIHLIASFQDMLLTSITSKWHSKILVHNVLVLHKKLDYYNNLPHTSNL